MAFGFYCGTWMLIAGGITLCNLSMDVRNNKLCLYCLAPSLLQFDLADVGKIDGLYLRLEKMRFVARYGAVFQQQGIDVEGGMLPAFLGDLNTHAARYRKSVLALFFIKHGYFSKVVAPHYAGVAHKRRHDQHGHFGFAFYISNLLM